MPFVDQHDLGSNNGFRKRVAIAMVKSAIAVKAEPANTMHHDARAALAFQVLRDMDNWVKVFVFAVVTNGSINASSTDADIEFTVNSIWDAIAV